MHTEQGARGFSAGNTVFSCDHRRQLLRVHRKTELKRNTHFFQERFEVSRMHAPHTPAVDPGGKNLPVSQGSLGGQVVVHGKPGGDPWEDRWWSMGGQVVVRGI